MNAYEWGGLVNGKRVNARRNVLGYLGVILSWTWFYYVSIIIWQITWDTLTPSSSEWKRVKFAICQSLF